MFSAVKILCIPINFALVYSNNDGKYITSCTEYVTHLFTCMGNS